MSLPISSSSPAAIPLTGPEEGVVNEEEVVPGDGMTAQFLEILASVLPETGAVSPTPEEEGAPLKGLPYADQGGNILPVKLNAMPPAFPLVSGELGEVKLGDKVLFASRMPPNGLPTELHVSTSLAVVPSGDGAELLPTRGLPLNVEAPLSSVQVQQAVLRQLQSIPASKEWGEPGFTLVPATSAPPLQSGGMPANNASAAPPSFSLSPPMGSPQWQNALGERVVWLVKRDLQQAELKLNPQHLGPVEVRIEIRNEQATIGLSAHHAVTRDALEASIPRLREMLGEAGLTLANVDVSQQRSGQGQQGGREQRERREELALSGGSGSRRLDEPSLHPAAGRRGRGLIDLFA